MNVTLFWPRRERLVFGAKSANKTFGMITFLPCGGYVRPSNLSLSNSESFVFSPHTGPPPFSLEDNLILFFNLNRG